MILSEKNVSRLTVLLPSFSILVLSVILTYAIISYQNFFLEKEFEEDKNSYIKNQKSIIQNEVSKIFDLIDFKNKVIQIRLQKKVENEMKSFYSIVESVYLTYKDTKTKEWILNHLATLLRDIRLNDNAGYINIYTLEGKAILLPQFDYYEGSSILSFRDITNSLYIKESILIAKQFGSGYFSNYEVKPDSQSDKEFYKINYIKYYEPLGIILNIGEYLDNVEKQIEQEILERINDIQFGKKGYVYVVDTNGILKAHRDKNLIGKNVFNIKDINGKYYFKDGFNEAKKNGSTFVEYISNTNSDKKNMYNAKKLTFAQYNKNYVST